MKRYIYRLMCVFALSSTWTANAQPNYNYSKLQKEKLGRGVVAIRESPSTVVVSWRYLSSDPMETDLMAVPLFRSDGNGFQCISWR